MYLKTISESRGWLSGTQMCSSTFMLKASTFLVPQNVTVFGHSALHKWLRRVTSGPMWVMFSQEEAITTQRERDTRAAPAAGQPCEGAAWGQPSASQGGKQTRWNLQNREKRNVCHLGRLVGGLFYGCPSRPVQKPISEALLHVNPKKDPFLPAGADRGPQTK